MDTQTIIIREILDRVVTAFYPDDCIVTMRLLLTSLNTKIKGDDIATKLNLSDKIVRRALGKLKDHKLLCSETIKEEGEYWYVDRKLALDTIKYRVYKMKDTFRPKVAAVEIKYQCGGCGEKFTGETKDMQRLVKGTTFQCDVCKSNDIQKFVKESDPIQENFDLLQNKLKPIESLLQKMTEIIVADHTTYSRKKTQANSNGTVTSHSSSRGMKSMFDDNNFEISVVLDNVPDYHHIPGVTTIIVDEEKVKKIVNTETPPWIQNSHQKEAARLKNSNHESRDDNIEIDNETKRKQNEIAIKKYLEEYQKYLAREQDYFLSEDDAMDIESDSSDMEDLFIRCGDKNVSIYDITTEDEENMETDEYIEYYKITSNALPHPL